MKRLSEHHSEIAELRRLSRVKQPRPLAAEPLGPALLGFFEKSVQKRQPKLRGISDAWTAQVPDGISRHCSLESFSRGTLTVIVDTAAHLYELKQLMLQGLQKRLIDECKAIGLRKVLIKRGRWYAGEDAGAVRF
jgi:Dna[CI] antecedent, DciA